MALRGLGYRFDLAVGSVPYDTNAGASTGKRIRLRDARAVAFVLYKGAGSGTDDPVLTLKEANASSGGTLQNLAAITKYYKKEATTLAGTETWAKTTQAAAATLTLTGSAQKQGIYVVEVSADALSDGFAYVELDVADTGAAGAQLGAVMAILSDLEVARDPANLAATLG